MKFLKPLAIALLILLIPAMGIVYYKTQTSSKNDKLKPVKLRNGDIVFESKLPNSATASLDTAIAK